MLWFWLKRLGISAEAMHKEIGVEQALKTSQFEDPMILVHTFLNYPLDMKPMNPENVMPRVWQAQTRGFYAFRNGWKSPDDIVAQIYAKDEPSCGWNQAEAGCFQIFGLGHPWAWKINDGQGKVGTRWLNNVVMLTQDPINCNARCTASYFKGDNATGSGIVTIDMDNVYQCMRMAKDYRGRDKLTAYHGGIKGLRSFAADYSGKASVPALFAVVDKIVGGKKKVWVFQLPKDYKKGENQPFADVIIDGNSFTIIRRDTSFRATFVSPLDVKIEIPPLPYKAHTLSKTDDAKFPGLHVTSQDGRSGEFFVVMTLQRETPPQVKVQGKGLASIVTVGNQTIRFDGLKIVLGL
jgi:hypothetical protein